MKSKVHRHAVAALLALTTSTLVFGAAFAPRASAVVPPPDNPVDRAILDVAQVVWPVPEDYQYDFTPLERLEGFVGMNDWPGGPLGSFPQPASSTDPETMPGFPGSGYPAMITELTGYNPRPAADESSDAARAINGLGSLAPCDDESECATGSPRTASPEVMAAGASASDGDPLDALAPVAALVFGPEESNEETTYAPVEYVPPADPPSSSL